METEQADWKWSLLFRALHKLADLPLQYQGWPFAHTDAELDDIIWWASEKLLPNFDNIPIPAVVLPLKRISRIAVEPSVALAWLRNFTKDKKFIMEYFA